jgi:hypothetical protein
MTDKKIELSNIYIGVTHLSQKGGFYSRKNPEKITFPFISQKQLSIGKLWGFGSKKTIK